MRVRCCLRVTKIAASARARDAPYPGRALATLQPEVARLQQPTRDNLEVRARQCQFKSTSTEFSREWFRFLVFQNVLTPTCKRALMVMSITSRLHEAVVAGRGPEGAAARCVV